MLSEKFGGCSVWLRARRKNIEPCISGITDDPPASKHRKSTSHRRKVDFRDEEDVINPEDIDPSVGKFRNLVQTQVIPSKRMRLHDNSFTNTDSSMFRPGVTTPNGDSIPQDTPLSGETHRPTSLFTSTPLMSSKLGELRSLPLLLVQLLYKIYVLNVANIVLTRKIILPSSFLSRAVCSDVCRCTVRPLRMMSRKTLASDLFSTGRQ